MPNASSPPSARARAPGTVSSIHAIFGPEKYVESGRPTASRSRSGPASPASSRTSPAVRVSCQTIALAIGSPVSRSQTTVVSRWLVMPIAATSPGSTPALARAPPITSRVRCQISPGSCSTQPARGWIWRCSRWSAQTMRPSRSNRIARVLVVPWSIAATYSPTAAPYVLAGARAIGVRALPARVVRAGAIGARALPARVVRDARDRRPDPCAPRRRGGVSSAAEVQERDDRTRGAGSGSTGSRARRRLASRSPLLGIGAVAVLAIVLAIGGAGRATRSPPRTRGPSRRRSPPPRSVTGSPAAAASARRRTVRARRARRSRSASTTARGSTRRRS